MADPPSTTKFPASSQNPPPQAINRSKVSRACDACKQRKTKCDGKCPCARCIRFSKACNFTGVDTRRRLQDDVVLTSHEHDQLFDTAFAFDAHNDPSIHAAGSLPFGVPSPALTLHQMGHTEQCEPRLPRSRSRSNSIFDRTYKNLRSELLPSQNSIHSFGDAALPDFDRLFFVLPPLATVREMTTQYFELESLTSSFLHCPTIIGWTEDLFNNFNASRNDPEEKSKRAIILMIMAIWHVYTNKDPDDSMRLFLAAEENLKQETGRVRLSSIQARLLQCYFLLSRSRVNQCYSIFGTVVTFVHTAGLHRKRTQHISDIVDSDLDLEYRKRAFWSAYTLDKYLSSTHGRPQKLHDDDIDQEYPPRISHHECTSSSIPYTHRDLKGWKDLLYADFIPQLSGIIGKILKDLHCIQPLQPEARLDVADHHNSDIGRLDDEFTTLIYTNFMPGDPIMLKQRIEPGFKLALAHARIILHQPFLLSDTSSYTQLQRSRVEVHIQECLQAATSIAEVVQSLYEKDPAFGALWFPHFCGYCAAVLLYIYVIKAQGRTPRAWPRYLTIAETLQNQISSVAERDSFASRCNQVLVELRNEVAGHIRPHENREAITGDAESWNFHIPVSRQPGRDGMFGVPIYRYEQDSSVFNRIDRLGFSSLTGY